MLLELAASPYTSSLFAQGEDAALLTDDALYRFSTTGAPSRTAVEPGEISALTDSAVLRWAAGALRSTPVSGGSSSTLLAWPHAPQRLVASGDRVAWLESDAPGLQRIWTAAGGEPRLVTPIAGRVATLTLRDDRVFFVEEQADARWRLGTVSLAGGSPSYASSKSGRPPALLVVGSEVFYYDGPTLSVYRASTDLKREERVANDVICSPLAVADRLYCAQPGGILALPLSGETKGVLVSGRPGLITAMVATRSTLTWLRESGDGGLVVESLSR